MGGAGLLEVGEDDVLFCKWGQIFGCLMWFEEDLRRGKKRGGEVTIVEELAPDEGDRS